MGLFDAFERSALTADGLLVLYYHLIAVHVDAYIHCVEQEWSGAIFHVNVDFG